MATVSETHLVNRYRVQPNHANNHGTLHGGNLMKWLDELAAMSAMRHAGRTCVTARVNALHFKRPIPVGDTALVESYAYESGRTSVNVRLQAWRENPRTGDRESTTESSFTFVAIDEDGRPTPVPELSVETDRCRELREAALAAAENDHRS